MSALTLLGLALAACQPLPQPFQPAATNKSANPLLNLPDRAGVVVLPIQGMPQDSGAALAREMASALIDRNLPAFTERGNLSSLELSGQAIATPRGGTRSEIRVIWRLSEPNGIQRGEHALDIATRQTAWDQGSPTLLREIAEKSAGRDRGDHSGPSRPRPHCQSRKTYAACLEDRRGSCDRRRAVADRTGNGSPPPGPARFIENAGRFHRYRRNCDTGPGPLGQRGTDRTKRPQAGLGCNGRRRARAW